MKKLLAMFIVGLVVCSGFSASANNVVAEKLLFYIPNRIVDAFDMFTVNVGVGPSVRIELMATRFCQGGLGVGVSGKLIKDYNRQYGVGVNNGWYWSLVALGQEQMMRTYTSRWVGSYEVDNLGTQPFTDPIYDIYSGQRDYWQIGGALGLGVEGEVYLHPIDVADFITGWFFIDLKGDDIGFETFE